MNIYIYGNKSFKKDIHDELDHSNIKFRLDDDSSIIELNTLDELKSAIENNLNDVFLIDDAKIIKKDGLNSKIKFLKPKDGIEDNYLFENGVGDINFDSLEELSKHIIRKIEEDKKAEYVKNDEIHETIVDIVKDAYDNENEIQNDDEFINENKSDEISLDDDLSSLLNPNDDEENHSTLNFDLENASEDDSVVNDDFLNELAQPVILNKNEESAFGDADDLLDELLSHEEEINEKVDNDMYEELDNLSINNSDFGGVTESKNNSSNVGVNSSFNSLDDISEKAIMSALNGEEIPLGNNQVLTSKQNDESIKLNLDNAEDITALLNELLKNKTLEITVKVK